MFFLGYPAQLVLQLRYDLRNVAMRFLLDGFIFRKCLCFYCGWFSAGVVLLGGYKFRNVLDMISNYDIDRIVMITLFKLDVTYC